MNERIQIAFKLTLIHIVLPIVITIASLFISNDAYLLIIITQSVFCILFLAGYWEFFGKIFKVMFFVMLEIILVLIFVYKILANVYSSNNIFFVLILSLIQIYLLYLLAKIIIVRYKKEATKLEIEFPLKNGEYLITDGGNSRTSRLMNYHYYSPVHKRNGTNNSMLYATDIVKISKSQFRFLPELNVEYPIYNENVYSPIDGEVVKVENNINDNEPFIGKYPYNTGNTVVIRNNNYYFLLGHLKKGSIMVKEGQIVERNKLIGQVGNSGFSERPHLHMQLIHCASDNYWFGNGISIQYEGKNIYKNRIIKIA